MTRRKAPISLASALFLTVLVIAGLGALAFRPSQAWSPPQRPGIAAPVVFDEFVNPANSAASASNEAAETAD